MDISEQEKEAIEQLTGGQLRSRMPPSEVEAVKGKPIRTERRAAYAYSSAITWIYPDMEVTFFGGVLRHVKIVDVATNAAAAKGGSR